MSLSTTQYGYIVDPMVPFTDDKGKTIKNGFIRVFMAGTSTPVLTYRNYDGATNQEKIELDNSGRVKHNVIGSKGSLYKVVVYNILHSQENPLLTVDKIAVLGSSINASGATIVTGLDSVTVQEENFLKATVEGTGVELALDPTEVTSEVSNIGAAETAAPDYVVPLLEKTGTEDSKKISLANIFKFALDWISRLATTITSFASGDFIAVSNTTIGARKMSKDTLLELTAQNALAGNVAEEFDPDKVGGYAPHDKVLVDNKLVEFTTFHASGAVNECEYVNVNAVDASEEITFSKGGYYLFTAKTSVGNIVDYYPDSSSNTNLKYAIIDVSDVLCLKFANALGHISGRLWAFVKADGSLISISQPAQSASSFTGVEYVPLSAKYALVNLQAGSVSLQKRGKKDVIKGNYISTSANVGVSIGGIVIGSSSYDCTIIKCTEGELFRVCGLGGSTPRTWAFFSSSLEMLAHANADTYINGFVKAPEGSAFLIFQVKTTFSDPFVDKCGAAEIPLQSPAQMSVYNTSVINNIIDINSKISAESNFVCSVADVGNYKYLLAIGEGGGSARLWAFLDGDGKVLSNSDANVIGQFLVQVPSGAKSVVFQSRNYGKCFLTDSSNYTPSVQSELLKMNNPTLEVLAGCFDSSGYLRDCYIPINLFKENKCAIVSLEFEYVSGTPDIRYYVDGVVSTAFYIGASGGKYLKSYRVPPAILGGNVYLRFVGLSGTNFKLKSIGIEYADPKASDNCGMRFDAHLGLQTFAPENTMVAYELANKVGFHGCIVNPIFSADGTAYCYHEGDSVLTLDGTNAVSLTGEAFEALTDEDVATYKVFGVSSQRSSFLEPIPTLDEFLKMCAKTGIKPVFSTHPVPTAENLASLKAMVAKYNLLGKLTLKAFDLQLLSDAYALFGKIDGYVYDVYNPANIDDVIAAVTASQFFTDGVRTAIEVNFSSVTEEMVAKVRAAGLEMGVYEINPTAFNYNSLLDWGVSFITEDGKNCNAGMNW